VSRSPSPRVARIAGLRWLTVILALAGLGVLHGAHCVDETPVAVVAMAAAAHDGWAGAADPLGPGSSILAATPEHDGHHERHPSPGAAAGACLFLTTAVVGTALLLADALRRAPLARSTGGALRPSRGGRPSVPIPLAELGVLRI
jgi:hypothetical protein